MCSNACLPSDPEILSEADCPAAGAGALPRPSPCSVCRPNCQLPAPSLPTRSLWLPDPALSSCRAGQKGWGISGACPSQCLMRVARHVPRHRCFPGGRAPKVFYGHIHGYMVGLSSSCPWWKCAWWSNSHWVSSLFCLLLYSSTSTFWDHLTNKQTTCT